MPDSGSAPGLYASRPRVSVEGTEEVALGQQLQGLFIEEATAGLCRCEATFVNWGPKNGSVGFLYFDRALLEFGKRLTVEMGAGDGAGKVFDGRITGLEGRFTGGRPPELLVMAEDRLQDLRMTRRTRSWEDSSDADVIRNLAQAHGLTADVDLGGPTHRVIAQVNQSDLALARERARAAGAELWIEGDTLKVRPRPDRGAGTLTLTYGEGLHEFAVAADLAHQTTAFTVSGWDVASKQAVQPQATSSVVQAELNGGDSGSSILESAFGKRPQQVVHDLPVNEDEARALAEAHFARAARRFVLGHGVAEGDARLRVGAELELKQVGPLFEGKYFVTRVRHVWDTVQGFRTAFSVERPALGEGRVIGDAFTLELMESRLPSGWGGLFYGAYPGIVTDVNDPDGQGRVKVRLPWSPDPSGAEYTAWARLATLMAGNNRGSWFIPDVDDEVLVVFAGGDPRHPCVVGAMWNGQDTPPHSMDAAGRNSIKKLRSRNGVQLTLDDTDGQETLILETPGGQQLTLKDGPGAVEIVDSNGNSVKLEAAGITITASAKITINAGATVDVTASMVKVSAGMSQFSGVVQCDTLITNSVVSASYTPGAGNVW